MFYRPTSLWTGALVLVTVAETVTVLAIEGVIFSIFRGSLRPNIAAIPVTRTIPTILSLLIFGFIYQSLLLYDTLATKNTIQLFGLCIYAVCLCVYTSLQVDQAERALDALASLNYVAPASSPSYDMRPLVLTNAIITGVYVLAISSISYKLYYEFQWSIYRQLNADLAMQRRYFTFKIYTTLLKFDMFFFVGFLLQFLTIVTSPVGVEFVLLLTALPLTIITLMSSTWFMRRENRPGMFIILFVHLVLLGFFIFKFARMYEPAFDDNYKPARRSLSYFGCNTIFLGFTTIVVALKCMANFNKGLKVHITGYGAARDLLEDREMEMAVFVNKTRK